MTARARALVLAVAAAFAAAWAGLLVDVHRDAVRHQLEPGVLCGPEGGCGDVLASEWATILGIPVSAPATPLFGAVAVLAALVVADRADARRVASLGVGCAAGGLLFGGWLLYHMLVSIGAVCRYCLVMDAATLAVLGSSLWLHPDGAVAAVQGVRDTVRNLVTPGPELAALGTLVLGTLVVPLVAPEPEEVEEQVVVVLENTHDEPAARSKGPPPPGTRRLVVPATGVDIEIDETTPVKGPSDAPITIAVFEDFQCPFCRKLTGNLEAFVAERPDQVRVAWFDFPMHGACNDREGIKDMHAQACAAAVAAECAHRQGRFWAYHDRLFQTARLGPDDLLQHARELELDLSAFRACQEGPSALEAVRSDTRIGARFGITGTPTFFVNGRRFAGGQPVEALRAIADAVTKEATETVTLDVTVADEIVGEVGSQPEEVRLQGPRGPFLIDTFEASVEDGVARSRSGVEPTRGLTWYEASAACEAAGKRLCTEDEWLVACTGEIPTDADGDGVFSDDPLSGRLHPYGAYPQPTWCASHRAKDDERPLLAGNHPRCRTPEGVFDLEGSVKEWVGLAPHEAALKGGSYWSRASARCAYHKLNEAPDARDDASGFRCCRGPAPARETEQFAGGKVGDDVQDWSAPLLAGGTVGADDLADRPYVLMFWATWCAPCREELPHLSELYERYRSEGLEVVAVSIDREPQAVRRYLAQQPLPFPIALDPDGALKARFHAPSTPSSFFVTRSGAIRQRQVGFDEKTGRRELEAHLQALLRAP